MSDTNNKNLPIYLLGQTPLSCYLAQKLSSIGENPIIITSPNNCQNTNPDITIKEEYNLQKHKYSCLFQSYTFSPAKLLIITSEICKLKSELLLLSPRNLSVSPCVIFSDEQDISIADNIVGKSLIRGWFNGWLSQENNTITLQGNEGEITLNKDYNNIEDCLSALSILNRTGIKTTSTEENSQTYWEHFSPKLLGAMLTAKEQQNISSICKNKEKRLEINELANELCSLAACNGAHLTSENICKKLYSIPAHYVFNTQKLDSSAICELNHYYHNLITRISGSKLRLPLLNKLMKEIYLRINPF